MTRGYSPTKLASPTPDPVAHRQLALAIGGLMIVSGVGIGFWMGFGNDPPRKATVREVATNTTPVARTEMPSPVTTVAQAPPAVTEPTHTPVKKSPVTPKPPEKKPVVTPPDPPKPEPKKPVPQAPPSVDFASVLPIFQARCNSCHNASNRKGGLDLGSLASLRKGGNAGQEVVPGDLNKSWLWTEIDVEAMPPDGKPKLTAAEKKLIREWILAGAK